MEIAANFPINDRDMSDERKRDRRRERDRERDWRKNWWKMNYFVYCSFAIEWYYEHIVILKLSTICRLLSYVIWPISTV